jgi:hypothetical protein
MTNVEFKDPVVRSFSLDQYELTWEIANTMLDPHDFNWYVERSESPMGPWDPVAGPFSDKYRFIDTRVKQLHRWRIIYYRLKSERKANTEDVSYSKSFFLGGEPDLIAQEIQMLERTVWQEFTGRRCWIFPVRTFGQHCPACFDGAGKGATMRRVRSCCLTCYDTGWARGFMDPIELHIQFDPSPKSTQMLGTGETQQSNTTARLGNFPKLKPRDVIVESENRRWRVVQVSSTERLRSTVHQELQLHEIVRGDIEFQLPINIDDLRNLNPSPGRNFTNPQNLESFEDEAIHKALKAYGYDND